MPEYDLCYYVDRGEETNAISSVGMTEGGEPYDGLYDILEQFTRAAYDAFEARVVSTLRGLMEEDDRRVIRCAVDAMRAPAVLTSVHTYTMGAEDSLDDEGPLRIRFWFSLSWQATQESN